MDSRVKPENDLHGRCAAGCQLSALETAMLRLKYDEERALNDNKERIFINHSGHYACHRKERATRKLWHFVDNCSLRRAHLGRRPKMKNTMLHMKLNSAVSALAVAAAFSVLLPPSNAFAGICFLPDCMDTDAPISINNDTAFCESKGFTYYASGKCPQYYAVVGTCNRDDHYLKCDAQTWCKNNGYNTTSCSIPNYVDQPCPSDATLYKGCKRDNDRACKETGFTKSCPSGQKLKKNSGRCS